MFDVDQFHVLFTASTHLFVDVIFFQNDKKFIYYTAIKLFTIIKLDQ